MSFRGQTSINPFHLDNDLAFRIRFYILKLGNVFLEFCSIKCGNILDTCLHFFNRTLRFTWRQLNRRVDDMAKGLIAIGVERGTHVGIWAANVPDWLTLLYACAKIGAVYVTVNTNYKQSELEYLCQNSDMHTLCIVNGEKDSDSRIENL